MNNKKILLSTLMAGLIAGGSSLVSTSAQADNHGAPAAVGEHAEHGKKKKKDKKKMAKKAQGDKNSCTGKDGCNGEHKDNAAPAAGGEHH